MAIISSVDCIEQGTDWKITIPTAALASNSLLIEPTSGQPNSSELFKMVQKVAQFWESKGVKNYLVYKSNEDTAWEMVPVQGTKTSFWDRSRAFAHQLYVVSSVTFGRYSVSESEKDRLITEYKDLASFDAKETASTVNQVAQDAFCKKAVIDSQLIWEGKYVRVLYNYAPIGSEGLHFLLVPKAHKEGLTELSQEEFEEVQTLAETLKQHYPNHRCYRYNKTGSLAGQTVPHFHEHVVFVLPQDDFKGKLSVFLRMITPPQPLNSQQLSERVSELKFKFNELE